MPSNASPFIVKCIHSKAHFFQSLARSEATCKSQILTAQAVKDDVGDVVATQKGINLWSRCSLSNSERDVHRVTKKQKTTLDVPISHVTIEDVKVPWISPRDWLIWIIRKGLWPRLAGAPLHQHAVAGEIWSNFWTEYEKIVQTLSCSACQTSTVPRPLHL